MYWAGKDEIIEIFIAIMIIIAVGFGSIELNNILFSSTNRWPTTTSFDISDWSAFNISSATLAYSSSVIKNGSTTMLATIVHSSYNGSLYLLIYLAPTSSEPPVYYPNVTIVYGGGTAEKIVFGNTSIYEPVDLRYENPCVIFSGSVIMYKVIPNTQILILFPKNFSATGYAVIWYIYQDNDYLFQIASVSEPLNPCTASNHVSAFP